MSTNPLTQTVPLLLQEGGVRVPNLGTLPTASAALGTYAEPTLREGEGEKLATGKQKQLPSLAVIACRQW